MVFVLVLAASFVITHGMSDLGATSATRLADLFGGDAGIFLSIALGCAYASLIGFASFGKPVYAVSLFLVLLPVSFLFSRTFELKIFESRYGDPILVSIVTVQLVLMAAIFRLRGIPLTKFNHRGVRKCIAVLWAFAVLASIVQVANHQLSVALALSAVSIWEFVLLLYVLSAAVDSIHDIRLLIIAMSGSAFFSVFLTLARFGMVGMFGSYNDAYYGTRFFTVANSPGGFAGYGAVLFTLLLYIVRSTKDWHQSLLWISAAVVLLALVVLTQTRGALIALSLVGLLFVWKSQRRFLFSAICGLGVLAVIIGAPLVAALVERPIATDIYSSDNAWSRILLWQISLPVTLENSLFGIGNAPLFNVPGNPIQVNSHSLLLYLVQDFGGLAALAFLVLIGHTLIALYKESRATDVNEDYSTMLPYFFVALLVWFAFSMTSSLSISMHTAKGNHFEETMVFYSVLYLSWFGVELSYEKRKQLIVCSPRGGQTPVRFIMPSRPGGSNHI